MACNVENINEEQNELFKKIRRLLGEPVRKVELADEQLCTLMEVAIEDYAEFVQNWLMENQWSSLLGKDVTKTDIAFALTVRSLDFESQFTYAYSKQVGLQNRGPWELKKDYVTIESGKQVYQVPAGREINEVMWLTPPTTKQALHSYYGGGVGFAGGYGAAQMGGGFGAGYGGGGYGNGGNGGYYIAPAFDVLLSAQDFNLKNRLIRSDLTYKVTAGPDGTRLLHLMSVPGSKTTFGMNPGGHNSLSLVGSAVWYFYYDTDGDADKCRLENKDIIKMPNEVPLAEIKWTDMNSPTKILIRQLVVAEAKRLLAKVRGKFSGAVGNPSSAERTMDYGMYQAEGDAEREATLKKLEDRLTRMSHAAMLTRKAQEAQDINTSLKYRPLGFYYK